MHDWWGAIRATIATLIVLGLAASFLHSLAAVLAAGARAGWGH
jgi:ABC-type nickel/cobalt efflux system permease component RcnA